jgi:transposase
MAKQRAKTTDPLSMGGSDEHDVGIDPHRKTLTATVLDGRGGTVATASFKVSGVGHRALLEWATGFGAVRRWGIESASGLGRHTAIFLIERGHDVRDVCPTRTAEQSRKRRQGKSDALDSLRIAREVQADSDLPVAFKRASGDAGPDETHELLNLWHNQRRSLVKSRQHLLNEADALLHDLPEEIRAELPDDRTIRPRLKALSNRDRAVTWDPVTALRLRLLDDHTAAIAELAASVHWSPTGRDRCHLDSVQVPTRTERDGAVDG